LIAHAAHRSPHVADELRSLALQWLVLAQQLENERERKDWRDARGWHPATRSRKLAHASSTAGTGEPLAMDGAGAGGASED
jgi:hypothetical protein